MEMYLIRSEDPLDHEGSADVVAVFNDRALADEAVALLSEKEEAKCREAWNERWRSFARGYTVEEWTVDTSPLAVVEEIYKEKS